MYCKPFCYPYQESNRSSRVGLLFPFVGGLLIGGLAAPYFNKSNYPYQQPYYQNYYQSYYPYQQSYIPTYQQGNYTYPYANGFYHY